MTFHTVNGIANLVALAGVASAIIIVAVAIGLAGWPWWQAGLAWSILAFFCGAALSAAVTSSEAFKDEKARR